MLLELDELEQRTPVEVPYEHGGVRAQVRRIALFDALYRGVDPFLSWAREAEDRRLLSLSLIMPEGILTLDKH